MAEHPDAYQKEIAREFGYCQSANRGMREIFFPLQLKDFAEGKYKKEELFDGKYVFETKNILFSMTVTSWHTGERIAKRCGVVFADDEDAAYRRAWEQFGSDTACRLWAEEVPENGMSFTVYKSEI